MDSIVPYLNLMNVKYVLSTKDLRNELTSDIMERSTFVPENRWGIDQTSFTINGKTKSVLFQHPRSTIRYPVRIPAEAGLSFSIGMSPDCWSSSKGDGVSFKIRVQEGPSIREVFSRAIDPKNNAEDRKWFDFSLDLANYEGKNVVLIFETEELKNNAFDWAGWGDLRLIEKSESSPFRLVYDHEIKIFQNTQYFPRAFMVPRAVFKKDEGQVLESLQKAEIDLRTCAILEVDEDGLEPPSVSSEAAHWEGKVEITKSDSSQVILKADLSKEGFLVLNDLYYPGWKATVDGKRHKIWRANYLFRALHLQPGNHVVEFVYDPLSFKLGWIASIVSLVSLGIFSVASRKRQGPA